MKKFLCIVLTLFGLTSCQSDPKISQLSVWHPNYHTVYTVPYDSNAPEEENLDDVQCPIPLKNRVKNHTGIQCVYSSLEMLGRWAEEPKLVNPPLTSRAECKGYSGPSQAAAVLNNLGVKFEQSTRDQTAGVRLIKKAMSEHRGCLFGVPGHAMVLVHYDEETDVVKWVDNSDRQLRIQTMTVARFKQRWDSWIIVIYADNDIISSKVGNLANKIPIIDRNNPQGEYPKNYIPQPKR